MTPRRRRQPRDGATRVESAFPTKGEVPTERGAAGTPWRLGRSCHLALLALRFVSRLVSQQCTQMPQSGAEGPDPPICVHYCDPKATHNPSPRRNSVHKRPKTVPRGHFGRSVYTPASPRLPATAPQPNSVHKRPETARRGPILPFVYTIAIPRPPTTKPTVQQCTQTPQNGAERPFSAICVHSCVPAPVRNGATAQHQQCTRMPQNDAERPFWPICVHSCVPTARVTGRGHWSHDVDGPMAL